MSEQQKKYDSWYRKTSNGSLMRKKAHQTYYERNKEKIKQRATEYYIKLKQTNPKKFKEIRKRAEQKFAQTPKGIFSILKTNSKLKNRRFDLIFIDFNSWYRAQIKECYYCGRPQNGKRLEIDRKDNNKGYELSNIALACEECNGVKGKYLSEKEMLIVGNLVMRLRWLK